MIKHSSHFICIANSLDFFFFLVVRSILLYNMPIIRFDPIFAAPGQDGPCLCKIKFALYKVTRFIVDVSSILQQIQDEMRR